MTKTDYALGLKVNEVLKAQGLENPINFDLANKTKVLDLEQPATTFCELLGLDLKHPSTKGTPHRLAKMYKNEICWGLDYKKFPACMITPNESNLDEIILIRNIEVKSLCEHHFMPVIGTAHIAYIPNKHLMGLSKFNRIVEFFARRPQLQERLCEQIHASLHFILETVDVAVIIEAEHFCVKFRGVEDQCSDTVTSKMSGRFKTIPEARSELLHLVRM